MSDNNKEPDPFDFDFDLLNQEEPQEKVPEVNAELSAGASDSAFDLNDPFGDDLAPVSEKAEVSAASASSASDSSFDLDNPFGDDLALVSEKTSVSEDNPYLGDDSFADSSLDESSKVSEEAVPPIAATGKAKGKKGFLGGLFGGKKAKTSKEKTPKEKQAKEKQARHKKEKAPKDKEAVNKPALPRDGGTILCIAFSAFLLVSLLMFNVATFLTGGNSLMQTLCFLGAFNIIGLMLVAVPMLFYKFPQERTLPNVLLGISVGALFTSVLFFVHNFYYYYGFTLNP